MNKTEHSAIKRAIIILGLEIEYAERSSYDDDDITVSERWIREALEELKAINNKAEGDKHERT